MNRRRKKFLLPNEAFTDNDRVKTIIEQIDLEATENGYFSPFSCLIVKGRIFLLRLEYVGQV